MFNMKYKTSIKDMLQGKDTSPKEEELIELKKKLNDLKGLQGSAKDYIAKTISLSSLLSTIEVEIAYLNDEIFRLMGELSLITENNMAFSEETSASMEEINTVIEHNVETVEKIISSIDELVKKNDDNIQNIDLMGKVCGEVT